MPKWEVKIEVEGPEEAMSLLGALMTWAWADAIKVITFKQERK